MNVGQKKGKLGTSKGKGKRDVGIGVQEGKRTLIGMEERSEVSSCSPGIRRGGKRNRKGKSGLARGRT